MACVELDRANESAGLPSWAEAGAGAVARLAGAAGAAFGSALAPALPPDPHNLAPILSTRDSDFSSWAWLGLGLGLGLGLRVTWLGLP